MSEGLVIFETQPNQRKTGIKLQNVDIFNALYSNNITGNQRMDEDSQTKRFYKTTDQFILYNGTIF